MDTKPQAEIQKPVVSKEVQDLQDALYLMNTEDHDDFCGLLHQLLTTDKWKDLAFIRRDIKSIIDKQERN